MTRTKLLLKTLAWNWRTNLAVWLGVVVATAVITGALIVGDSVHGSLREMTLARLGQIDHVLSSTRFVRENLADDLSALPEFQARFAAAAPAIVLPASLEKPDSTGEHAEARAGAATVYGLDRRAWALLDTRQAEPPADDGCLVSAGVARQLRVQTGDVVTVFVEVPSEAPRESLLGERERTSVQIPLTVSEVLDETSGLGRLGLLPDQQIPRNVIVSLATLQDRLGLAQRRASRRDPVERPARINCLFVAAKDSVDGMARHASEAARTLTDLLPSAWTLADLDLRVVPQAAHGYISLESERMILDPPLADAAEAVARRLHAKTSPAMVYIANEISVASREAGIDAPSEPTVYSRYSVVAGLNPATFTDPAAAPFGPFEFVGKPLAEPLGDGRLDDIGASGQIYINDWLAADLDAEVGDILRLSYHVVGSHGELPEEDRRFEVKGIVRLDGTIAADRGITPEARGITDAASFDEWKAPFPMRHVTARDEAYWQRYRATPKAFVTLNAAQHLWQTRFGKLTSIRIAPPDGAAPALFAEEFSRRLLRELRPESLGLAFQPVKFQGLAASAGTTDFGGLFIGFSLFLILAAALLVGLLFRLGVEQRAAPSGLLLAVGFSSRQVRRLLLGEGLVVVVAGAGAGLFCAIFYARLIVYGLTTWWVGAIGTRFLEVYLHAASLFAGAAVAVAVGLSAVFWGTLVLGRSTPRALLSGSTEPALGQVNRARRRRLARALSQIFICVAGVGTALVVMGLVPPSEAFGGVSWPALVFFLVGIATLAACIAALAGWLDGKTATAIRGAGLSGSARLGVRNALRHRSRSLLSVALVAYATFLIVAIAAGHRNPAGEVPDFNSGNGGFTLVAESAIPVLADLNHRSDRAQFGLDEPAAFETLQKVKRVFSFQSNPGENASCLNLYRTTQPTILGVGDAMIERGGFRFAGTRRDFPWKLLLEAEPDGAIPVLGDMNTLQYSLHLGVGDELEIRDELQQPVRLRIAGMFDGSVFQGMLLMEASAFRRLFPSRSGYSYFLIEAPPADAQAIAQLLESRIPGFDAELVSARLASFLAVQNTYLSTFEALGWLGLLLGTIGVGAAMLRNVLDRRGELALLRAVGFSERRLAWLVVCETAFLLGCGLAAGTLSALIAMGPHLVGAGADFSWAEVAGLLLSVFCAGLLGALAAARAAVSTPVVATLRGG